MEDSVVAIVYWGRLGSERLNRDLIHLLEVNKIKYITSFNSETQLAKDFKGLHITLPKLKILYFFPNHNKISKIVSNMKISKVDKVIITMHHPWDNKLTRCLHKSGITVIKIIHDALPHPGSIWPNRLSIKRMVRNSDVLVFLSSYVANFYTGLIKRSFTASIPVSVNVPRWSEKDNEGYVLFTGRLEKYKGFKTLEYLSRELSNLEIKFIVAGRQKVHPNFGDNTFVINKWLSESEMESLISKAGVVIFPYTEASQSGVLKLAASIGTPIVANKIGGLVEQSINANGLLVENNPEKFLKAILETLSTPMRTSAVLNDDLTIWSEIFNLKNEIRNSMLD